jgi:hypothetical protein
MGVLGELVHVHIEWMDGFEIDIEAAAEPVVYEGVLRIQRYDSSKPGFVGRKISYPVANIRSWE